MQRRSITERLKNAPLWWHLCFLGLLVGFGRTLFAGSVTLGGLLLLAFLILLVGPVGFVPFPQHDAVPLPLALVAMILLVAIYYSPLFIVKRGDQYRGMLVYRKKWIRLLKMYMIVNVISACIAIPWALRQRTSEEEPLVGEVREESAQSGKGTRTDGP